MFHWCSVTKSCATLDDPMTVNHQASLSMGFSRKEYWMCCHSSGDLLDPETEPRSPTLQADSLLTERESFLLSRSVKVQQWAPLLPLHPPPGRMRVKHLLVVGVFPTQNFSTCRVWGAGGLDSLCVMLWMAPWRLDGLLERYQLKQKVLCAVVVFLFVC